MTMHGLYVYYFANRKVILQFDTEELLIIRK